ncbi:MobH family relaxase [Aquimonas sp.]|jgi:conjugal transfer pilus assembly protein TraI|uniref:MobH family relaxase n=1 Tax=Aquimonas sp. TaxID=1872588 RepID=UPI0037BF2E26
MLNRILKLFSPRTPEASRSEPPSLKALLSEPPRQSFNRDGVNIDAPTSFEDAPVPRYPERSPPIPAIEPAVLLDTQQETVDRLRQSLGYTRPEFARWVMPVLLRYAERVHLLPASEADHHCGRGGMLRHGLEAAFFAARLCEGRVWAFDMLAERRKTLDPKWRLAAVFAALLHDLGKVVVDVNAVDESGELQWSGHGASLWAWLARHKISAYYIYWRPGPRSMRHIAFGPVLLREIVGPDLLDYLSDEGGHEILNKLVTAFTNPEDKTNPIAEIAHKADRSSADFDLEDQARRIAASGGSPLRTHAGMLARAMTQLVEDGTWNITKTGPLFHTAAGLFGAIPDVFTVPIARLRQGGHLKGFPSETGQLIDLLVRMHMLELGPDKRAVWPVRIEGRDAVLELNLVRFAHPGQILGAQEAVPPMPAELVRAGSPQPTPAAPSPSAASAAVSASLEPAPPPPSPPQPRAAAAPLTPARMQTSTSTEEPAAPLTTTNARAVPAFTVENTTPPEGQGDATPQTPRAAATRPGAGRPLETDHDRALAVIRQAIAEVPEKNGGARWVRAIMERFVSGELRWHTHAALVEGRTVVAFPHAFADLGVDPVDLRDRLFSEGWLEMDPAAQRLVVAISTEHGRIEGSLFVEQLTPTWTILREHLPLLDLPEPRAESGDLDGRELPIRRSTGEITALQMTTPARSAVPEFFENLKAQVRAELRTAGLDRTPPIEAPKAQVKRYRDALTKLLGQSRIRREFSKPDFSLLLASTRNPLVLVKQDEAGANYVELNPQYVEPVFE